MLHAFMQGMKFRSGKPYGNQMRESRQPISHTYTSQLKAIVHM